MNRHVLFLLALFFGSVGCASSGAAGSSSEPPNPSASHGDGTGVSGAGPSSVGPSSTVLSDAGAPATTGTTTVGSEVCGDGLDNDQNGQVDDGCPCTLGSSQSCWLGPIAKRGVGLCLDGTQQCELDGEFASWGACIGASPPGYDVPGNGVDEDCDGQDAPPDGSGYDDGSGDSSFPGGDPSFGDDGTQNGCACQPGSQRWCHVPGPCSWGRQTCQADGNWNPCTEVPDRPAGCEFGGSYQYDDPDDVFYYNVFCCVASGGCCDNEDGWYDLYDPNQPVHASVGACTNVCQ